MSPKTFPLLLAISLTLPLYLATATIHDHLRHNGLPEGLFPTNITGFTYNTTTGTFTVTFPQPCTAKVKNELHFELNVTGTMSYAKIGNLSGMLSLELFLWFPVHGIRVDVPSSGIVHFDVGVADKKVSTAEFEFPTDCTAAVVEDKDFGGDVHLSFGDDQNPLKEPGDKLNRREILGADS